MRLLNTSTIELEEIFEPENLSNERKIPRYAILSHRWGDEEITL